MNEYPSQAFLQELQDFLGDFFPQNITEPMKQKKEQSILKAYEGIFDIQFEAITIIREIGISHLLGMNDVVVQCLVDEYGRLALKLKELDNALKKLKQFGELKETLDKAKDLVKPGLLADFLYKDLETLASLFDLEIDFKEQVSSMKKVKG